MNREQLIIHALTRPTDVIWESAGPDQFPRPKYLRGQIGWHRYNVWRDQLGAHVYDEEAGLASIEHLTEKERETVRAQCAFIRKHTKPMPIWKLPESTFLPSKWLSDRAEPPTAFDLSADLRRARVRYYDRNWNRIAERQFGDDLSACTLRAATKARPEWWGIAKALRV